MCINLPLIGATWLLIYRIWRNYIFVQFIVHTFVLVFYPLSLLLSNPLVADVFLARCLGVEDQGDNETVKTQDFSENQDQNLVCKQAKNKGQLCFISLVPKHLFHLPCQQTF